MDVAEQICPMLPGAHAPPQVCFLAQSGSTVADSHSTGNEACCHNYTRNKIQPKGMHHGEIIVQECAEEGQ
jgi:hypothetical protein